METPQHLTRRQRELLEEFEAEANAKSSPESEGFFAKVREFFEGGGNVSKQGQGSALDPQGGSGPLTPS